MNIKFYYLYRDAGNYKNYSEIIFSNNDNVDINYIEQNLKQFFIDSIYFEANKINLPELYFNDWNIDDHDWHEYIKLENTSEKITDLKKRSILKFIADVQLWYNTYNRKKIYIT